MSLDIPDNTDVKSQKIRQLNFSAWIEYQKRHGWWVTVAQHIIDSDDEVSKYEMVSMLTDVTNRALDFKESWNDLCKGLQERNDFNVKNLRYYEHPNMSPNNNISTFVMPRKWHSDKISIIDFDVIQDFVFFYNLRLEGQIFMNITNTSNVDVIRIRKKGNNVIVDIRRQYLMDYLVSKNKSLIRIHHNSIKSSTSLNDFGINNLKPNKTIKSTNSKYVISMSTITDNSFGFQTVSVLDGYDIIKSNKYSNKDKKQYCKFIVGCDKVGNPIKKKSGPRSNDLSRIFFNKSVLEKYYHDESRYVVSSNILWYGKIWNMRFSHGDRFINVYLCDLGDLPYEEQCHWLLYNVLDRESMPEGQFQRDFGARFVPNWDLISILKDSLEKLQKVSLERFGFELFKRLGEYDIRVIDCLRIPSPYDESLFYDQVLGLAKLLSDSINIEEIDSQILPANNKDTLRNRRRKQIDTLRRFLDKYKITTNLSVLYDIQHLRSYGHAHRRTEKYERIVDELHLHDHTWDVNFQRFMYHLTRLLDDLYHQIMINVNKIAVPKSQKLVSTVYTKTQLKRILEFKNWLELQKMNNSWVVVGSENEYHDDKIRIQYQTMSVLENTTNLKSCLQEIDIRELREGLQEYDIDPDNKTKKIILR